LSTKPVFDYHISYRADQYKDIGHAKINKKAGKQTYFLRAAYASAFLRGYPEE
jgi:hypothetical protein